MAKFSVLDFYKFEALDFKYGNNILKFHPKNKKTKSLWSKTQSSFSFH